MDVKNIDSALIKDIEEFVKETFEAVTTSMDDKASPEQKEKEIAEAVQEAVDVANRFIHLDESKKQFIKYMVPSFVKLVMYIPSVFKGK